MADVAESPALDPHERAFRELLARFAPFAGAMLAAADAEGIGGGTRW